MPSTRWTCSRSCSTATTGTGPASSSGRYAERAAAHPPRRTGPGRPSPARPSRPRCRDRGCRPRRPRRCSGGSAAAWNSAIASRSIAVIDLGTPDDLTADRMIREHRRREHVVHEIVGRVVAHADLFEDHLTLGLDVVGTQRRRPHDVGEDVEREREALIGNAHVERGELLGGERVHVAAHRLDLLGDLDRGAAARCP